MKTINTRWLAAGSCAAALIFFFACSKNSSGGSNPNIPAGHSQLSLYMMDDPIQFTKVLIDIRQVVVEVDTASKQTDPDNNDQWNDSYCGFHRSQQNRSIIWDTLSITPGSYDLLQLRNGMDTLLGAGLYVNGKILKIRITLGSDNKVYTDSATAWPLVVFGPSPAFTINVSRTDVSSVTNNEFKLWLDFNLSRSIAYWSGEFYLRPYITVFNDQLYAKLQGRVLPKGAGTLVTVYNATDTLYAIPDWFTGKYLLRGVPAGTYSVSFKGRSGYNDTTISNILVDSMKLVNIPTVTLHK